MIVNIMDIETYKEMFLYCSIMADTKEKNQFEISYRRNDLYSFIKFLRERTFTHECSFNGIGFDAQVIQFILDNYEKWHDWDNLQVVSEIYRISQEIIDRQKYENLAPLYREKHLEIPQIDLFRIHHYNNKARHCSLKWIEFSTDQKVLDELPIHHAQENLTSDDLDRIIEYCWNDIEATETLYNITIGNTELELYKGKNKILDRLNFKEETGIECLNWSDVQIGEEWNKKDYLDMTKRDPKTIYPQKVRTFYGMKYKQFFPKTVKFKTEKVKRFIKEFGDSFITNEKQEFKLELGNNIICLGKGGIHSSEKSRIFKSDKDYVYIQTDIGSQYPNAYRKYKLYPIHLGPEANTMVIKKIQQRLDYKAKFKETKDPKYASLQEMGKLSLNGGLYGKLKQKGSFLEDHICQLTITIGCQLEILMVVEDLIDRGFNVVSLNTDGFDTYIERSRLEEFYKICSEHEEAIGNKELGNFEYTEFEWIVQTSVNDYLAKEPSGKLKSKGDWAWDMELHKNKSRRIVPLALKDYFENNTPIEETIRNHRNIYDFCVGVKASSDYYYKGVIKSTGESHNYNKLLRYYISTTGEKLFKVKHDHSEKKGPKNKELEAGHPYQTVFSKAWFPTDFSEYNIDYQYYIDKCNRIIFSLYPELKRKAENNKKQQLSLFKKY